MQIGLEEKDLAVEGVPLVLQLQRLDLGQDLVHGGSTYHHARSCSRPHRSSYSHKKKGYHHKMSVKDGQYER